MKKIALFLTLALCLGVFVPFAVSADDIIPVEFEVIEGALERTPGVDCYEMLGNPGFEVMDTETTYYEWGFTSHLGRDNTYVGCGLTDRSTDAHSGEYAARITLEKEGESCDLVFGLVIEAGETYEFSIWQKRVKEGNAGNVHLLFAGSGITANYTFDRAKMNFNDAPIGEWVQRTIRFVCPENATQVSICLRSSGPAEILWDDASFKHITDEMPAPEVDPAKEPLEYIEIMNPGFEADTAGAAPNKANGWEPQFEAKISNEYAHSGNNSLELTIPVGKSDVLVFQSVSGFEEGATYQVSMWVRVPGEKKVDVCPWFYWSSKEFFDYGDISTQLGQSKRHTIYRKNDDWELLVYEFTPPAGARSCEFDIRLRSYPGTAYIDDVCIYMVKRPYALVTETDETFYYSEFPTGVCEGVPYVLDDPANSTAVFSFVDLNGNESHQETFTNLSNGAKYVFRTEWMAEKGQRYHIRVKVYDPTGALIDEHEHPVYRYDRPTYLGADGVFRKNGKEYVYMMGTGVNDQIFPYNPPAAGCTIVQLIKDDSTMIERLDKAYEMGLLAIIGCYYGTSCAGSPDQIENTKAIVSSVKDHPAVFAYMLQDEPYQKGQPVEEMIAGYTTIRNIDPHHPVFVDDSVPGAYEWLFRYSDFFDVDYYGGADPNAGRLMTDIMDSVMAASKGRKPFSIMQQCFDYLGFMPTVDQMRHLAYQSFFSGACGYSFHSLASDDGIQQNYVTRPEYQEIIDRWAPWEKDFMYGCFVTRDYAFVNYSRTEDVLWGTFTDGKDIYAIVLNRDINKTVTANVPLQDAMGTVKIDDFTATTMTGESKRVTGNATLSVELAPYEAVVYKVTPHNATDLSGLKTSKYRDIISYPWAFNAIATLEEKGIVNDAAPVWYGPGQNITRGDYAMFLVRTLGLSGEGENFADVAPDAEYAKELAIGKATGILQGVGDNKFNPEAQITRQDMMTMTSRAMSLAGSADLAAFSDNGAIADYAAAHVSAMVAEGLIRGNADGTINPLGNTTRAEAAVIMHRILEK